MPFRFFYVCDLLQRLEDNLRARSGVRTNADIIREWFRTHHGLIAREDQDATPLLSTLLPEKRSDRVYFIKERRLQTIIGRGLGLGRSRIQQLGRWQESGSGVDLAACVESILKETVSGGVFGISRAANDGQSRIPYRQFSEM
jgi:DNA ligase 4